MNNMESIVLITAQSYAVNELQDNNLGNDNFPKPRIMMSHLCETIRHSLYFGFAKNRLKEF